MPICPSCGLANAADARFCQSCGAAAGEPGSGAPAGFAPGPAVYAGFWQRVVASLIDWLFLGFATAVLAGVTAGGWALAGVAIPWLYEAFMLSGERQATLGKMALGIVVTDLDRRRLTFGRATGRHFAKYLSAILFGIGFLMAAFTEKKQALHDLVAGTLAIRTP